MSGSLSDSMFEFGSDLCSCGDYRSQHDALGCKACRTSRALWDGCTEFRFWRHASETEHRHWSNWKNSQAGVECRRCEMEKAGNYPLGSEFCLHTCNSSNQHEGDKR